MISGRSTCPTIRLCRQPGSGACVSLREATRERCMRWVGAAVAIVLLSATVVPGASAQTGVPLNYAQPLSQAGTATVQQRLKQAGAYKGRTDGIWGGDSATALMRFQRGHDLQATGQLNQATVATLSLSPAELLAPAPAGVPTTASAPSAASTAAEPLTPEVVRTIQSRLHQLGFYSGGIDGIWGPGMQSSIEHFQQGRGLQATGQLNPTTVTALGLDPSNLAAAPPAVTLVR